MSENPGPPATGRHAHGDEQQHPPVDTGPGPDEADLRRQGDDAAEHAGEEHPDAG